MATHDEIAALLNKIYLFFISIGYVKEADMRWAPHASSDLDGNLCREAGLDDHGIDFLKTIPWAVDYPHLTPHGYLVNWSEEWAVRGSRFPTFADDWEYLNESDELFYERLAGHLMPLSFTATEEGTTVVIDTQQGTAVRWTNNDPYSWRDAVDAGEMLESIYQKYVNLEYIPVFSCAPILSMSVESESEHMRAPFHWRYARVKEALLRYGWPDNFRKDDWVGDICGLQDKVEEQWKVMERSMSKEDKNKLWHPDSREEAVNKLEREWAAKETELSEHDMSRLAIQDNDTDSRSQDLVKAQHGREF